MNFYAANSQENHKDFQSYVEPGALKKGPKHCFLAAANNIIASVQSPELILILLAENSIQYVYDTVFYSVAKPKKFQMIKFDTLMI